MEAEDELHAQLKKADLDGAFTTVVVYLALERRRKQCYLGGG